MDMPCLVRDSVVWTPLSFIGTLVSHNTILVECGVVRMGGTLSATITVYMRPMIR